MPPVSEQPATPNAHRSPVPGRSCHRRTVPSAPSACCRQRPPLPPQATHSLLQPYIPAHSPWLRSSTNPTRQECKAAATQASEEPPRIVGAAGHVASPEHARASTIPLLPHIVICEIRQAASESISGPSNALPHRQASLREQSGLGGRVLRTRAG